MASTIALFHNHLLFLVITLLVHAIAQVNTNVSVGSALFAIDDNSTWTSPSGDFSFGFRRLPGQQDLFLLAIWFAKIPDETIVWSANGRHPAERESKVELNTTGQLELKTPGELELWRSNNSENPQVSNGAMLDTGNFVIISKNSSIIWNSFDEPTNTMIPTQVLGFGSSLFSTMSEKSYGVGKFQLHFRQPNISNSSYDLILNQISIYTQYPYGAYYAERNVTELIMDKSGYLLVKNSPGAISNLSLEGEVLRTDSDSYYRATLDFDGVFRLYTHPKNFTGNQTWSATWYAPDNICLDILDTLGSGPCGYNSICSLRAYGKPECQCAPGFSLLDVNSKYSGCKQGDVSYMHECNEMGAVISEDQFEILEMENVDWPLTAFELLQPTTEFECKKSCLHDCYCTVAIFQDPKYNNGTGRCWKKRLPLSNGRYNRNAVDRKALFKILKLNRSLQNPTNPDPGQGKQDQAISILAVLLGTSVFFNFISIAAISLLVFCLWQGKLPNFYRTLHTKDLDMNLRSFTYKDLEEATSGFKEELGRGSFGIVYKGVIVSSYRKYVAIKKRCVEVEMERAAILTEWAYDCYSRGKVERLVENDEEAISDMNWVKKLVMVAIWCVQDVPLLRPSMREVTHMLEGILEISAPPCPFLYSSTFEAESSSMGFSNNSMKK
ncbi:hypothetical protein CMV_030175 [Castanea mollissima]|uniref:Bulb-type lectin domain-containing protein n=1 Tax=Castanea mollissima TaxID=60419 RepID=A0A8J4Q1K2_9ROSI|nr:hypothetical protein CMV_030175 [Castanea mollissima]